MRVTYSPDINVLYIALLAKPPKRLTQREIAPNTIGDFGPKGELVGIEILDASRYGTAEELAKFARPGGGPSMALSDAAAFSGLKASTLRNQILNGRIRATKSGRDWMVDLNDLEAYLDGRKAAGRRSATEKPRRRRTTRVPSKG